jgi:putative heme iron utilization protein
MTDRDVLLSIRNLLSSNRVLALAVTVENEPEAAMLPFAPRAGFDAVYVQASGLARHAKGLTEGAHVGVLVHTPDAADADPMQLPRLTVRATVKVLDKSSDEFAAAAAAFVERFPAAQMTLELGDFNLYALTFGRGRYVEGFARAFNVGPDTFKEISAL